MIKSQKAISESKKNLLPPFSINSDALVTDDFGKTSKTIQSLNMSSSITNIKSFCFFKQGQQFICFYYEFDNKQNKIEVLDCGKPDRRHVLFSRNLDRAFLDPIMIKYCPRLNIFCFLESTSPGCHRIGHKIGIYQISGRGFRNLKALRAPFGELFECFEIISSLKVVAITSRNAINFWGIYSRTSYSVTAPESISSIKYLPGKELLACGGRQNIFIYSLKQKNDINLLYQLRGHYDCVTSLCWNPRDSNLVSIDYESRILFWKIEERKYILLKSFEGKDSSYVEGIYFFPEMNSFVTGDNHHISLIDSENGSVKKTLHNVGKIIGSDLQNQCFIVWKGQKLKFIEFDKILENKKIDLPLA